MLEKWLEQEKEFGVNSKFNLREIEKTGLGSFVKDRSK